MTRYFFDLRDVRGLFTDEEGLEFDTQLEAEIEAAMSLADMARDFADIRQNVAVEVRADRDVVFQAAFVFSRNQTKH